MTARCVWVIELDGVPRVTRNDRYAGFEELVRWRVAHGKRARLVRYAPSSKTERNRTKQHARAAKKRGAR